MSDEAATLPNMLVEYSDSDTSDTEVNNPSQALRAASPPKKKVFSDLSTLLPKPKGRKAKDASADGTTKIIVNLPKIGNEDFDQPPAKKARLGGGGSGLSALLPAPKKKSGAPRNNALDVPSQLTEPAVDEAQYGITNEQKDEDKEKQTTDAEKPKQKTTNTTFVPQSVARKPIQPMSAFRKKGGTTATATASTGTVKKAAPPKVSLFGITSTTSNKPKVLKTISGRDYKPIMLESMKPAEKPTDHTETSENATTESETILEHGGMQTATVQPVNDLDEVARQIGLDDDAMRHMYGRRGRGDQPIKFANFSVDDEYRQNELERQLGLAEEAKPVRAIQPGRHQLRTLLSAAQSQKSALEESFAAGKRNRKEAGSKYGW